MSIYLEKPQTSWDIQKNLYIHSLVEILKDYHQYSHSMNRAIIVFRIVKNLLDELKIENSLHYVQLENKNVGLILDSGGVFWSIFGSDSKKQIALQFGVDEKSLKILKESADIDKKNIFIEEDNYEDFLLSENSINDIYFVRRRMENSLDFSEMIIGEKEIFEIELERRKNILKSDKNELGVYSWHELEEMTSLPQQILDLKKKLLEFSKTNENELVSSLIEKIQVNEEKLMALLSNGKEQIVFYDLSDNERKYKKIKINQNCEDDERALILLLEIYNDALTIERNPAYSDTTHNNKYIPISLDFMRGVLSGNDFNLIKDNKIISMKKIIDLNSNEIRENCNYEEIIKMKNEILLKNNILKTKNVVKSMGRF